MNYDCLIIEGGGFKTAFTAGVIDAFIATKFYPFKSLIGISGGSVALSYYLSHQYKSIIKALRFLAKDDQFANYKRTFSEKGYLDIDYIATVASEKVPFHIEKAVKHAKNMAITVVATDKDLGVAAYITPTKEDWIQAVIASSTLPFATKGNHSLNGKTYFDGGWSDPLPIKWAYDQGYRNIAVIRTKPKDVREKQSWSDYFGSMYFSSVPKLSKVFDKAFIKYNESLDFMETPPEDARITQIAPKNYLKSGTYSYSKQTLMLDYRYGLDKGLNFVCSQV